MDIFDERSASPMLIAQQTDPFDSPDWIYELKVDGFRCLAYVDDGLVDFRNKRNMPVLSRFPELAGICENVKGRCILDGEVAVLTGGVPDFYRLQKRTLLTDRFKIELESARFPASFVAFDCIYLDDHELLMEPLTTRKEALSNLIDENDRIAISRFVETRGRQLYLAADLRKLEGVVAKRKDSPYYMGRRTKDWIKFKRMSDEDYVVAGYMQKGRHTYSLILGKYQNGELIYKGHVTAGVTKDAVAAMQSSESNPFVSLPVGNECAVWVKPDHVCVVEYMPNLRNSLRQPVFKGFREDVSPENVRIE